MSRAEVRLHSFYRRTDLGEAALGCFPGCGFRDDLSASSACDRCADPFGGRPLVVPLPGSAGIASLVTAGLTTIGLRVPAHPAMQALLKAAGRPLAAPSANVSGTISPTRAEHVAKSLGGRIPLIVDSGPTLRGIDDLHQYAVLPFLGDAFGDDVLEPIKLHVDAKRYLCATRAGYHESLSADSRRSLRLQGGIHSPEEAAAFIAKPYAVDAVNVRLWDDLAKVDGASTPPLAHYVTLLETVRRHAA
jgi:hypothetical protein